MSRASTWAVVALVALSTLGEGGSAPTGLLAWHAVLAVALAWEILRGGAAASCPTVPLGLRLAFAGYGAVVLVGMLVAPYGYAAWLYGLEVAAAGALAWLAARAGDGVLARLSRPVLTVATLQSVVLLYERIVLGEPRPAATFLNPNHFAAWAVAALFLTWGGRFVAERTSRGRDVSNVVFSVVVAVAVAVTGSRGALVGLVAGAVAVAALGWPALSRRARRTATVGFAVVMIGAAIGVAWRAAGTDPFRYQRVRIWRAAIEIVASRPLLGSGPGQMPTVARGFQFPDGDGPLRYDRGFATTHSDLLRVPCDLGVPGLVALAGVLAAIASQVVQRKKRGDLSPAAVGAVAALVALGAQSLVDNLSSRSALVVLGASLVGAIASTPRLEASRTRVLPRLTLLVLLGLVFLVGDLAPWAGWRALHGLPRGRLADADRIRLDRAIERNPIHPDSWRRRAEHITGDGTSWDLAGYSRAREAAERALRLDPRSAQSWVSVARVEAAACRSLFVSDPATRARANRAYDEAAARDPFHAPWALEHAEAALDCDDPAVAARAARRAIELEPESASPRLVLAGALLRLDEPTAPEEAEALLAEAESKTAEWAAWIPTGSYARRLLALDPRNLERVRRGIDAARAAR